MSGFGDRLKSGIETFVGCDTDHHDICGDLCRRNQPLHTVLGNVIKLPKIDKPTDEDVAKYHKIYIEKLVDLFERNKARYGYADRTINLY